MAHDHTAHGHAHDPKGDARAAFMGLIFGMIALLVICYTIVILTSKKFEGHAPASAAPTAPH
jgi:hypothetical protein